MVEQTRCWYVNFKPFCPLIIFGIKHNKHSGSKDPRKEVEHFNAEKCENFKKKSKIFFNGKKQGSFSKIKWTFFFCDSAKPRNPIILKSLHNDQINTTKDNNFDEEGNLHHLHRLTPNFEINETVCNHCKLVIYKGVGGQRNE